MRTFHEPVQLHIGGQTRAFMFTPRAMRTAERVLKADPRTALATGGENTLFVMAACALLHDPAAKADDKRVDGWITHDPKSYVPLMEAVAEAARRYYVTLGVVAEDEPSPGGDEAPPTSNP